MARPVLNANYATQIGVLGDAINLDTSTAWTGVDAGSFTAFNLPPGLAISAGGTIIGNIGMGGVLDTQINVVGTDGSKASAGIKWLISLS